MRTLIFGFILLAVAAAGFHTLISSSLAAGQNAGSPNDLLQCTSQQVSPRTATPADLLTNR